MSEQKMREALESIAANTCCNSCQEAALVAQKALAQPDDVGLTDAEIDLINESNWSRKGNTWYDREFARAVIQAHEAKKNGGWGVNINTFTLIAVLLLFHAIGAISHEQDIQDSCKEYGHSRYSTWLGRLECKPYEKENHHDRTE